MDLRAVRRFHRIFAECCLPARNATVTAGSNSTANADRPTIALNAMLQVVCFPFGLLGFLTWPSYVIGSFRDTVPE
jgi:hypothetical protein